MKIYIYTLENPVTGEIRYVGKTNNLKKRYNYHCYASIKHNNKLGQWLKSLKNKGLKPLQKSLDETENNWEDLEIYWIAQLKSWGFKLTNSTPGGGGNGGGGEHHKKIVSLYDKNGDYIGTFLSINECSEFLNLSNTNISRFLTGNVKSLKKKNYQVKYGDSKDNIGKIKLRKIHRKQNLDKPHKNSKPIKCIEDDLIFNSLSLASIYYNVALTTIYNILNHGTKSKIRKTFLYL